MRQMHHKFTKSYEVTMEPNTVYLPEEGQFSLKEGRCPYCDGWLEGTEFTGEDDRNGGLVECAVCFTRFAWIDNPFECEMTEPDDVL
jgi:hypothetical protein